MTKRIVLVGPPGVGKSTIIALAKRKGIFAIDMEDYSPKDVRIAKMQELMKNYKYKQVIFGAADIGGHFPTDVEKNLLLPPKETYLKRFHQRDKNQQQKRNQNQKGEEIYDWFVKMKDTGQRRYDRVIEEDITPEETLALILQKT